MSEHANKTGSEATSMAGAAATVQRWPKVVASPVLWESGAVAYRLGKAPRSPHRPRRLAPSPDQRAVLW